MYENNNLTFKRDRTVHRRETKNRMPIFTEFVGRINFLIAVFMSVDIPYNGSERLEKKTIENEEFCSTPKRNEMKNRIAVNANCMTMQI